LARTCTVSFSRKLFLLA